MEERAGKIIGGRYRFFEEHMRKHRAWEAKQKEGAEFITYIKKVSQNREQSQLNAHWERCTIIGEDEAVHADKRTVSNWLMEDAFEHTQNPAFGEFVTMGGKRQFSPASVAELQKNEVWELKRAAYKRLQFLNDGRESSEWALFPERGANGVILRMCAMWEERPATEEQP